MIRRVHLFRLSSPACDISVGGFWESFGEHWHRSVSSVKRTAFRNESGSTDSFLLSPCSQCGFSHLHCKVVSRSWTIVDIIFGDMAKLNWRPHYFFFWIYHWVLFQIWPSLPEGSKHWKQTESKRKKNRILTLRKMTLMWTFSRVCPYIYHFHGILNITFDYGISKASSPPICILRAFGQKTYQPRYITY